MNKSIENYGFDDYFKKQLEAIDIKEESLVPARVTTVHKGIYRIIYDNREKIARPKSSNMYKDLLVYPTVGDFVLVKPNSYGDDIIYHLLDKKSKFSRYDSHYEREQLVAANFDHVFIISSLNYDFNLRRIERYLSIAWESGGSPAIILSKSDLIDDVEEYKTGLDTIAVGVPVFFISSVTGEGIQELRDYLKPRDTIVFLGSSGVGKSSLVNSLSGKDIMKVNDIREDDSKGRHTTTHRELIMLDIGTMVIDTPGMRELGVWNIEDGIDTTFKDIEELSQHCRFNDCRHETEPGCAIKEALLNGELSQKRWNNYLKLQKEAKFTAKKEKMNLIKKKSKNKIKYK